MARVPLIDPESAPADVRALFELGGGARRPLNVARLIANQPDFFAGFQVIVRGLYRNNELPPRLRELAYLRASQLNGCHY